MRQIKKTLTNAHGGHLSETSFVPRDIWFQDTTIPNVMEKIEILNAISTTIARHEEDIRISYKDLSATLDQTHRDLKKRLR